MKFKLDVSVITVIDRPSYLAPSMIITPAGKRVESTSWQQRKGDMTYRLVDPQTKKEIDDRRVIAVRENPLLVESSIVRLQMASKCSGNFGLARLLRRTDPHS